MEIVAHKRVDTSPKFARRVERMSHSILGHMERFAAKKGDGWREQFYRRFSDLLPEYDYVEGGIVPSVCLRIATLSGTQDIPYITAFPNELSHKNRTKRPSKLLRGTTMTQLDLMVQVAMSLSDISAESLVGAQETSRARNAGLKLDDEVYDRFYFPIYKHLVLSGFEHYELTHEGMKWRSLPESGICVLDSKMVE